MIPEYIEKEDLIIVLRSHVSEEEYDKYDWDNIIEDGRISNNPCNGVTGCYVYEIDPGDTLPLTVWIHPITGTEVYYDPFRSREELGI